MSNISEQCYCAGWMDGLEYSIWAALVGGDIKYGQSEIDRATLNTIKWLSDQTETWIVWRDSRHGVDAAGNYAIPMSVWIEEYKKAARP